MYYNLKQVNPYPSIHSPLRIVEQCWYFHFRLLSMQRANDALKTSEDFSLETGDSTPCFSIHKTLMFNNKTFSVPKGYSMSKWALLLKVFIVLIAAFPMKMLQADDVLKTSEEYSLEKFEGKLPSKELPVIVVPDGTPSLSTSFTFFFTKVTKFSLCISQHKKQQKL